jgi:hypothetical protein
MRNQGWEIGGRIAGNLIEQFPREKIDDDKVTLYVHPISHLSVDEKVSGATGFSDIKTRVSPSHAQMGPDPAESTIPDIPGYAELTGDTRRRFTEDGQHMLVSVGSGSNASDALKDQDSEVGTRIAFQLGQANRRQRWEAEMNTTSAPTRSS